VHEFDADEWIPLAEAAKRLGLTEDAVQYLVDNGHLDFEEPERGKLLVDAGAVEFDADELLNAALDAGFSRRTQATRTKKACKNRPAVDEDEDDYEYDHHLPTADCLLPTDHWPDPERYHFDEPLITTQQAAECLGISVGRVRSLIQDGRLNATKEEGRWWILLTDVKNYRHMQHRWARLGGEWTPYGRRELKGRHRQMMEGPARRRQPRRYDEYSVIAEENAARQADRSLPHARQSGRKQSEPGKADSTEEQWITATEAARMLGITREAVYAYIKKGALTMERQPWAYKRGTGANPQSHPRIAVKLSEVLALAEARERKTWQRGITPKQWKTDLRHPIVRTTIEAPPGDSLLTRTEAAHVLDVTLSKVSLLVAAGHLFAWQKEPGKPGSRMWLSASQVWRYANDPIRLKRKAAQDSNRAPEPRAEPTDHDLWLEENRLDPESAHAKSWLERDFGEFFTTAQAARELGITRASVHLLRHRGRLKGY
jgi:excisionase family DNA binding protein